MKSEVIAFCLTCEHSSMFMFNKEKIVCDKFPNGIPDEIFIKGTCEFWSGINYDDDEDDDLI